MSGSTQLCTAASTAAVVAPSRPVAPPPGLPPLLLRVEALAYRSGSLTSSVTTSETMRRQKKRVSPDSEGAPMVAQNAGSSCSRMACGAHTNTTCHIMLSKRGCYTRTGNNADNTYTPGGGNVTFIVGITVCSS